ncbi:MAG: hypothetical protein U1F43_20830 [Myxococcota bacterium]
MRELMRGDELPDDADGGERFAADLPVLVDAEADAWAADAAGPTLLVRVRRYEAAPLPTPADLKALERDVGQILQRGERVGETVGPDGVREHWVEGGRGRQLVLVRKAPAGPVSARAPFRLADASDIRMGPWANDRPGAFRSEERWLATAVDGAAPTWERWRLVLEGAHATHQTGRDADLSYPLADARKRFVEAVDQIDIKATWRWFVLLHATGETLGVDVERIIVGPRVLARLLAEVPEARGSRLIKDKVIRVVGGHDDHHHIRIATPTAEADAAALEALTRPASAEAAPPATAPALP